ncbi:MAG: cyclic nucleotide-binding domain-containing protein [Bdellovibrionales bacterium]|nr:cyclic nucleotide-binding domain-containing protein [Bdellovibrionales bacterium]
MPATPKTFKQGQFLFKDGQASNSLFIIRKGTVSVRKMKGSNFVEIGRIYPNQVLGELSFFDRQPRSAAAMADGDVEALEIDFESLEKIWKETPDYFKAIMKSVADRLRKANETIRKLKPSQELDPDAQTVFEAERDVEG